MRVPTLAVVVAVLTVLLPIRVRAAASGDANDDARISVADGVQAWRAAVELARCAKRRCDVDGSGRVTVNDGLQILRHAAGLGAAKRSSALAPPPATTPVAVHFMLQATAALEGFQLGVTYPLAKGGFRGSADGVACTSNGGGFFVANDRDDGTLVLLQANVTALTFPIEIVCLFDQSAGAGAKGNGRRRDGPRGRRERGRGRSGRSRGDRLARGGVGDLRRRRGRFHVEARRGDRSRMDRHLPPARLCRTMPR